MGYCSLRNRRKLKTMNKAKFKIGDRLYFKGSKCVVMDILYNDGKYQYQVVLDENQTTRFALEYELLITLPIVENVNPLMYENKKESLHSFEIFLRNLNLKEEQLTKSCRNLIRDFRDTYKIVNDYNEEGFTFTSTFSKKDLQNFAKKLVILEGVIIKKIKWFKNNSDSIQIRKENLARGKMEKTKLRETLPKEEPKTNPSKPKRGRPKKNKSSFPPLPITFPNKDWGAIQQAEANEFSIYVKEVIELKKMIDNLTELVLKQNKDVEKTIEVKEPIVKDVLQNIIDNLRVGQKKTFNGYAFSKIKTCIQKSEPSGKDFHVIEKRKGNKIQVQVYRLS